MSFFLSFFLSCLFCCFFLSCFFSAARDFSNRLFRCHMMNSEMPSCNLKQTPFYMPSDELLVLHGAFLWSCFYWYGLFELYFRLSVTEDSAKMEWRFSRWRRRDTKLCSLEWVSLYASSHIVLLSIMWTDKHVHRKDGESLFFSESLAAPWLSVRVNGCGWSTWQFLPLYQ